MRLSAEHKKERRDSKAVKANDVEHALSNKPNNSGGATVAGGAVVAGAAVGGAAAAGLKMMTGR